MSNFNQYEFDCKCFCGETTTNVALRIILEDIRNHFGKPVTITSAKRCVKHNEAIGGAKGSKHVLGEAADIMVYGVVPELVYGYIDTQCYAEFIGMGLYDTFVHIDVRGDTVRWEKS